MAVLYSNFQSGTITNNPLVNSGTTLNSAGLSTLPVVAGADTMWMVLNPRSIGGLPPEIVLVTSHTAAATSCTISRAQQSTIAQTYPSGTEWIVGVTKSDLDSFFLKSGGVVTGSFQVSSGDSIFDNNVTVGGNLTVNGTTFTLNSTTVTVDDPIITLGGDTAPGSDDNKDRGVEFRWHNGTVAKAGFFGFDDSTGKFTFIPDATNTSEVFSGTKGEIDASLAWANLLNVPSPVVTVTLTGAITGSAGATLAALASGTASIATTIAAGAVTLGTHTTGQYVSDVTGTANQVTTTPTGTSPRTIALSLPQNIHTGATPTFSRLTLTQGTGTAPLTVSSTTMVTNLNAEMVGGQTLTNLDARYLLTGGGGTVTSGAISMGNRLGQHYNLYSTTYGLGVQASTAYIRTATNLAVYAGGVHSDNLLDPGSGGTELLRLSSSIFTYKANTIWHSGNDGSGSTLDADLLDGQEGSWYRSWANLTGLPSPTITVSLAGKVTGSGNVTWTSLSGSPTVSITNIALNADLGDLANVNAPSATDERVLQYDDTTSKWTVGPAIHVGPSAPSAPVDGDIWFDSSPATGTSATQRIYIQPDAPVSTEETYLWIQTGLPGKNGEADFALWFEDGT